jgi:hypothetical protein
MTALTLVSTALIALEVALQALVMTPETAGPGGPKTAPDSPGWQSYGGSYISRRADWVKHEEPSRLPEILVRPSIDRALN